MAENIVSPGVFTRENDFSFIPQGVAEIGAAIIGPTIKGPAFVPIKVTSFSEYSTIFGTTFQSGSKYYEYFTSLAAEYYLRNSSALTVVRVLSGSYSQATASVVLATTPETAASISYIITSTIGVPATGSILFKTGSSTVFTITFTGSSETDTPTRKYVSTPIASATNIGNAITTILNDSASAFFTASFGSITASSGFGSTGNTFSIHTSSIDSGDSVSFAFNITDNTGSFLGGVDPVEAVSFKLTTLGDGAIMNSVGAFGSNNSLVNGSKDNLRYEISNKNNETGTFTLSIRRGDDTEDRKVYLEQFTNVNLDPNSTNYIVRAIGDQYYTLMDSATSDPFIQLTGEYPNISKYVRVSEVLDTVDYLDTNGNVRVPAASASIPAQGSGSYGGAFGGGSDGSITHPQNFFSTSAGTNVQGYNPTLAYAPAIALLKNADEYDINLLIAPGVTLKDHGTTVTALKNLAEERGDVFIIVDPVEHGITTLATVTSQANNLISSYGATYWPWVKIAAPRLNRNVWVPPSVVMPGVLSYSDSVSAEWYAPAGLTRGGIDIAVEAERKLTKANRDTLYDGRINPIATFPGQGVTVFGQKTLQKKATSLDRVNVRRLLINLKKFIASTSRFLIFENNTSTTRNRFLNTVNPYMEQVQQNQGLYAFRVIMDDTNNTPDIIDRNILKGDIYIQPARAAEFIIIDFNVLPTGATFGN